MKRKKIDKIALILVLAGVFLIFTSACLNANKNVSDFAYVYDVVSTVGTIMIPVGVALILK